MNFAMWEMDDTDPEEVVLPGQAAPALVSLLFMREALRRRRSWWVTAAMLGLLGATLFLVVIPPAHRANATVSLAHDPTADQAAAMATDVSLATTRAVAAQSITRLGLTETPTQFLSRVSAVPTTNDVLTLTLGAPTDREATRELNVYSSVFLSFRAQQLTTQSDLLSQGSNKRIDSLRSQSQDISDQIDSLSRKESANSTQISSLISQRTQLQDQISTLQQSVEDATLGTTAIVAASRLIDDAAVKPSSPLRRLVLVLMTGLIGCTAMGVGLVLVVAILSDKLHTRVEVATALEVPVATSVGRVIPIPRLLTWFPGVRRQNKRRADEMQRLAGAIKKAIPGKGAGQWLAVGCIDNAEEVALGVVLAAAELQRSGLIVRVIDMTEQGLTEAVLEAVRGGGSDLKLAISRPRTLPSLARDVSDIMTYGPETREIPALSETDVFLTVADLDPAIGAYHLSAWTNRVLVAVTAGLSGAEKVRTAAELVRAAGLELHGGILIRSEQRDASSVYPLGVTAGTDADQAP